MKISQHGHLGNGVSPQGVLVIAHDQYGRLRRRLDAGL